LRHIWVRRGDELSDVCFRPGCRWRRRYSAGAATVREYRDPRWWRGVWVRMRRPPPCFASAGLGDSNVARGMVDAALGSVRVLQALQALRDRSLSLPEKTELELWRAAFGGPRKKGGRHGRRRA
jgi:hypothetical protein